MRRPERPQYDSPGRSPGYRADHMTETLKGRDSTTGPMTHRFVGQILVMKRRMSFLNGVFRPFRAHHSLHVRPQGDGKVRVARFALPWAITFCPFRAESRFHDSTIGHWLRHAATFAHQLLAPIGCDHLRGRDSDGVEVC